MTATKRYWTHGMYNLVKNIEFWGSSYGPTKRRVFFYQPGMFGYLKATKCTFKNVFEYTYNSDDSLFQPNESAVNDLLTYIWKKKCISFMKVMNQLPP